MGLNPIKIKSQVDAICRQLENEERRVLLRAGRHIQRCIKDKLGQRRRSRPGEAPGRVTGNLSKGVVVVEARESHTVIVGTKAPAYHAHLLEAGHRMVGRKGKAVAAGKLTRVEARPFFYNTFTEQKAEVENIMLGLKVD